MYVLRKYHCRTQDSIYAALDELGALQIQAANIQESVAVHSDAGAFTASRMQELERSLLTVEKHIWTVQAERHTLRAKES